MNSLLAPSILSADFIKLSEEIKTVRDAGADMLHLDIMDGHFVPNITFGPKMVSDINRITDLPLDIHLMISEPERYAADFAKAGADWISVHYEAVKHLNRLVNQIKELGCKAGVVINPATSVESIEEILPFADYILVMSVNPGFGGQKFIRTSLAKVKKLRRMLEASNPGALIEMDGGIGLDNMEDIKNSGVNVFVCGNSIFGSKDVSKTIKEMKKILKS
jgi:ribulose-phosphate 3-epimerase